MPSNMPKQGASRKPKSGPSWRLSILAAGGQALPMAGNNIALIRKAKGLSQTDLAEKAGTTLNQLGKLERGARRLNQTWLERIASALEVEPYELIGPIGVEEPGGDARPWLPSDATLAFLMEAALPALTGGGGSVHDRVELAALAVGSAIRALSKHPHSEGDPAAMNMLAGIIADLIERASPHSTP